MTPPTIGNSNDIISSFMAKIDPVSLVLIAVICILAFLLYKSLARMDNFLLEMKLSGQTMNKLTVLLENLVYGRKQGNTEK